MDGRGLELRGLRRSFGGLVAVDGLSFSVPEGRLVGFVGRNGAGKTTTMRIVCRLLAADAGSVSWDGGLIDDKVRERIGYMPEERGLYPKMRIGDQLEYFAVLQLVAGSARAGRPRRRTCRGVVARQSAARPARGCSGAPPTSADPG
jgi:ABC-2 type transport system ATP-binding protein